MKKGIHRAFAALVAVALLGAGTTAAVAEKSAPGKGAHAPLPAGPIRDRHELMEKMGRDAKAIGGAMKAGRPGDAARPASDIAAAAMRFLEMFPEGSQGHGSRAKPAVWTDRKAFNAFGEELRDKATALAASAAGGGDVSGASRAMFGKCKACHDQFREPSEDE